MGQIVRIVRPVARPAPCGACAALAAACDALSAATAGLRGGTLPRGHGPPSRNHEPGRERPTATSSAAVLSYHGHSLSHATHSRRPRAAAHSAADEQGVEGEPFDQRRRDDHRRLDAAGHLRLAGHAFVGAAGQPADAVGGTDHHQAHADLGQFDQRTLGGTAAPPPPRRTREPPPPTTHPDPTTATFANLFTESISFVQKPLRRAGCHPPPSINGDESLRR